ncbi:MAG: hypothetical protein EGQ54_08405 [[Ruminococcus] lactaris]|nr:hypothetical protein [[Ruminococcus] lactaris]
MRLGKITQAAWNRSVRKPLKKKQCTVGKMAWEQKCAELGQQIQKMEQSQKTEQDQKTEQGQRIGSGRMTVWSTASAGGKNANVGAYAVIKAAGELASQKVMAEGISIHAILPEQMQEEDVKHLTDIVGELCKKMNLEICQIQVETSSFVTQMVVTATVVGEKKSTAIREQEMTVTGEQKPAAVREQERTDVSEEKQTVAGQELLLCGYAGLEGTLRILDESEEELGTRFVPAFLEKAKLLREKLVLPDQILSVKEQVSDIRQIGSGGILAALWELGEELQTGFDIDFSKIALKQETVEICEFYQLNPYLMTSAGSFLLVTGQSEEVIAYLAEQGVSAVRLGCMKDQNARVIKNGEETRYLDRPAADELARWWKEHA